MTIRGEVHRVRGNSDKTSSRALGERIEKLAAIVAQGERIDQDMRAWINAQEPRIRDWLVERDILPRTDEGRRVPLDSLIDEYVTGMAAHGSDAMHVYNTEHRLDKLMTECGWRHASDVTMTGLDAWIAPRTKKLAAKTLKDYHSTLRAFMTWCVDVRRVCWENPISPVRKGDYVGAKKRKRRALTLAELDALLECCKKEHKLCYMTVVYCQLRRADAQAVTWGDVQLDVLNPYLVTRPETSKGKRETKHPLRRDLAAALRAFKPEGATDTDRVFPNLPSMKAYKADLKRAGIDYTDASGRQADFHALGRHTPNTLMANAGVPVRVAQQLMRHTDPKLTAGAYTDSELLETAQAVEMLPAIGTGEHLKEPAILQMEGTNNQPIDPEVAKCDHECDHGKRRDKPHASSMGRAAEADNAVNDNEAELVTCGAGSVCDGDGSDWQGENEGRGNGPENWAARTRT